MEHSWPEIAKVPHIKPSTFNLKITRTRRIRKKLRMATRKNPAVTSRDTTRVGMEIPGIPLSARRKVRERVNKVGFRPSFALRFLVGAPRRFYRNFRDDGRGLPLQAKRQADSSDI